ncbi:MAG: hypothetical protein ACKVOQ_12035 [Cyclobacteriaceae bacterium]
MKKNLLLSVLLLLSLTIILSSCGGGSDSPQPTSSDLGTFLGSVQVSNDPQTGLGYLLNAKVVVSRKGSDVTIKVTGDPGFDREYTGSVIAEVPQNKAYSISLKQQTKPTTKTVAGNLVISGNSLAFDANTNSDNVNAIDNGKTITISGKVTMIGTNMIRQ